MLEDMKFKIFKDILNSFEKNDFKAFEKLMTETRKLYNADK